MGATCTRERLPRSRNTSEATKGSEPVTLHVYNIGTSRQARVVNSILRQLGTGAFHCGVEAYGCEWSYSDVMLLPGEDAYSVGTGIFCCQPRSCEGHSYCDSIAMGTTSMTENQVLEMMAMLKKDWPVFAYSTLQKNCCHFCDELCQRLGVGSIPKWVKNLAGAGAALLQAGDTLCCKSLGAQGPRELLCCGATDCGPGGAETISVDILEAMPVLPAMSRSAPRTSSRSTPRTKRAPHSARGADTEL